MFRAEGINYPTALLILGVLVLGCSGFALLVRFSPATEKTAASEYAEAMARRRRDTRDQSGEPAGPSGSGYSTPASSDSTRSAATRLP